MALRHEGEHRVGGDRGVMDVGPVAERAVRVLLAGEVFKGARGGLFGIFVHLDFMLRLLRAQCRSEENDDDGREANGCAHSR